jgi:hypothetical protein
VLIGSFNPAIFQPMWFAKEDLIDERDANTAQNVIVTQDLTVFSIDTGFQFKLQVDKSRFVLTTRNPAHFIVLRDLVTQTFEILEHTPVRQLGINRDVHYRVSTDDRWTAIGDILVPKSPWHKFTAPKTLSLVIQGHRAGGNAQYVQTTVRPSVLFPSEKVLEINTNEHYDWDPDVSAGKAIKTIADNWDAAYAFSQELGESIFQCGVENE